MYDSLVQTVRIFSDDIGMKFGLDKCAAMALGEDESCKYIGVLEADHEEHAMAMHGMLHPRSSVSRLYLPRSEGGRGLLSVSDSGNIGRRRLQCYVISVFVLMKSC